jgi:hypothetical protein
MGPYQWGEDLRVEKLVGRGWTVRVWWGVEVAGCFFWVAPDFFSTTSATFIYRDGSRQGFKVIIETDTLRLGTPNRTGRGHQLSKALTSSPVPTTQFLSRTG